MPNSFLLQNYLLSLIMLVLYFWLRTQSTNVKHNGTLIPHRWLALTASLAVSLCKQDHMHFIMGRVAVEVTNALAVQGAESVIHA